MTKYQLHIPIKSATGYDVVEVEADSAAEARAQYSAGEYDLIDTEWTRIDLNPDDMDITEMETQ